jgi:hypothetical protein
MKPQFSEEQMALLVQLRRSLSAHFATDTAYPGTQSPVPSAGHCAVVAAIVALTIGGQLARTTLHGLSHWMNRVRHDNQLWDIDLTGDQFGLPTIQVAHAGKLYPDGMVQDIASLNVETLQRALKLAERANMRDTVPRLIALLKSKEAAQSC